MLETTVETERRGEAVAFTVRVANDGDEDAKLNFSDSQRVRVTVYGDDGRDGHDEARWRSDEGEMFMQMLGTETVPAGGEAVFEAVWEAADPGEYRVVGEVVCQNEELRAETTCSV